MSAQERIYIANEIPFGHPPMALHQRTGALFGVPSVHDYQPEIARRYAEYFVMLRTGKPMANLNDIYFPFSGWTPDGFNRRLLEVAGARYLVVSTAADRIAFVIVPPPAQVDATAEVRVYDNPEALPRARWVPRAEVEADSSTLLHRLAFGSDQLREMVLLEATPPSGFLGALRDSVGAAVGFDRDEPEHVALRVQAPAPGFVVLADQDFPGWSATVGGRPAAILRANYAFRAVEVPAGESVVEFRYRPVSVPIGAAVSALTALALGVALVAARRRGAARERPPARAVTAAASADRRA